MSRIADRDYGCGETTTQRITPGQRAAARRVLAGVALRRHPLDREAAAADLSTVLDVLGLLDVPPAGPRLCGCGCGHELPAGAILAGHTWRSSCRQRATSIRRKETP